MINKLLSKFRKNNEGIAAMEFALIAPVLITMFLGTVETSQYMWANTKITDVSGGISDLITQETVLDDGSLQPIMAAIEPLLAPLDTSSAVVTVTSAVSCEIGGAKEFRILWSRRWNVNSNSFVTTPYQADAIVTSIPASLALNDNDSIVMVEFDYTYRPGIHFLMSATKDITEINFFRPRNSDRVRYIGSDVSNNYCSNYNGSNQGGGTGATGSDDDGA